MANKTLGARETSLVTLPCASATVIEQGDQCYWDKTNSLVKPYSSQSDQLSEEANQVEAAANHLGVCYSPSNDGDTTVVVDIGRKVTVYDVTVPSGTYRFGTLLGPSETSGGTALEDQQLEAVTLFEEATHVVMDDSSSARAVVAATPIKSFALPKPSGMGIIELPLFSFQLATGVALAVFADGASATPGYAVVDSEALGIRWNNHATPAAIGRSFLWPADLDPSKDAVLHALVSKTGATVGDATSLTTTLFNSAVPGALHDADADFGGATGAVTGDATAKTVTELTRTLAAADLPQGAFPAACSLTIKPTAGTLGTDDLVLHAVWIEYAKKQNG
jgi:hypothetical protein